MGRNSKPKIDLTGQVFTYLTALYYIKGGKWHCRCKCGNEVDVDTRNLNSGHTKSCGCLRKEKAINNTIDMLYFENENIKVLERAGSDEQQIALWACLCKVCGNIFITRGSSLRAGYVNSCGCVHSKNEQNIAALLLNNNIEFATQYTFPDLVGVHGGRLRFDFAIFKDNKLSHLIEYNGMQHYTKPEGSWAHTYEILVEHDKRKKDFCKDNNIRLVIIQYNQKYGIEDLL
jgi:hypothetical protein